MTMNATSIPRTGVSTETHAALAGFGWLLRSEWTKFRTVRGWVIGMVVAAMLTVLVGLLAAAGSHIGCGNGVRQLSGKACLPYIPYGPGGEVVSDSFNFARQPLTGDGTITVRVISLSGAHANITNGHGAAAGAGPNLVPGLAAWSKAGIIIKASLRQGSAYAAMMVTGANGVRMQFNYTGDTPGLPGLVSAASPRWLRLTRSGDTVIGYDSVDGTHWTQVGTVTLTGLPATAQVGLFATSPAYTVTSSSFGGDSNNGGPSQATGVFDDVRVSGTAAGGTYTLTGSGDIAPVTPGPASGYPTATIGQSLAGAFIGLIAIIVVAAMFFTAEYRRGLIRTTLVATPRRGAVLAAKAIVAGGVTFVVGLVAGWVAIVVGGMLETNGGQVVLPVPALTEIRVVVGTSAMLAVAAVFAVALGAVLRRSAAAITIAVVTVVLPFLLAALNVFPSGAGDWLLRLTPAAGLAIEQSVPNYPQVTSVINPSNGYYPLSPFAGFAVLCAWAIAALALAGYLLRRRDA
jgi:ABC-type transport system involved in multi-copper enzyme maturation permease subunit